MDLFLDYLLGIKHCAMNKIHLSRCSQTRREYRHLNRSIVGVEGIQPRLKGEVLLEKIVFKLVAVGQMTLGKRDTGRVFRQTDQHMQRLGGKRAGHIHATASSYIFCALVRLIL